MKLEEYINGFFADIMVFEFFQILGRSIVVEVDGGLNHPDMPRIPLYKENSKQLCEGEIKRWANYGLQMGWYLHCKHNDARKNKCFEKKDMIVIRIRGDWIKNDYISAKQAIYDALDELLCNPPDHAKLIRLEPSSNIN
ncbi:hypothetical protein B14911_03349 [Bacillus sp. NRRL B-14911]|uniref:Uncharacterized protein n=1 Tax=Bacillus infantis NRRL B-14911 TaxID=1367477 RepID=U5LGD5_9BACI|nr:MULTISPECIES: hypothetical protein [Bacillus]AGX06483.1 hypothetical protein N288_23220 [Bacillus infantis NRRL B-14911]EAR68586.1 hypothetical protein B14911_03349 [Bacillus sp. NRRL B-14911]